MLSLLILYASIAIAYVFLFRVINPVSILLRAFGLGFLICPKCWTFYTVLAACIFMGLDLQQIIIWPIVAATFAIAADYTVCFWQLYVSEYLNSKLTQPFS